MSQNRYSMSFTSGGLFHQESVKLSTLYLVLRDWNKVRCEVIEKNILQARTLSTLGRVSREVISRLKTLRDEELSFLVDANYHEQGYLLWVAICRRYKLIAEFAIEVLRERYISLKVDLSFDDFDSFFNRKSEWHLDLDVLKPARRNKLRQVIFRMLREANLLAANHIINAAILSPELVNLISGGNHHDFLYFPVFESDLKVMMR